MSAALQPRCGCKVTPLWHSQIADVLKSFLEVKGVSDYFIMKAGEKKKLDQYTITEGDVNLSSWSKKIK